MVNSDPTADSSPADPTAAEAPSTKNTDGQSSSLSSSPSQVPPPPPRSSMDHYDSIDQASDEIDVVLKAIRSTMAEAHRRMTESSKYRDEDRRGIMDYLHYMLKKLGKIILRLPSTSLEHKRKTAEIILEVLYEVDVANYRHTLENFEETIRDCQRSGSRKRTLSNSYFYALSIKGSAQVIQRCRNMGPLGQVYADHLELEEGRRRPDGRGDLSTEFLVCLGAHSHVCPEVTHWMMDAYRDLRQVFVRSLLAIDVGSNLDRLIGAYVDFASGEMDRLEPSWNDDNTVEKKDVKEDKGGDGEEDKGEDEKGDGGEDEEEAEEEEEEGDHGYSSENNSDCVDAATGLLSYKFDSVSRRRSRWSASSFF